jgi:hypothetical protein
VQEPTPTPVAEVHQQQDVPTSDDEMPPLIEVPLPTPIEVPAHRRGAVLGSELKAVLLATLEKIQNDTQYVSADVLKVFNLLNLPTLFSE